MQRFKLLKRHRAFSLIELLVVITLLSTLIAMLFPATLQVQKKARQSSCASNLRQIGMAFALYAQDYDERYAYGADPLDKNTGIWGVIPSDDPVLKDMPLLQEVLSPYTDTINLWKCPDDVGFDAVEFHRDQNDQPIILNARPSLFDAFGTSYLYRTELAFRQVTFPAVGYVAGNFSAERSPAEVNVLEDGHGSWHGGLSLDDKRYNILYADGHARLESWDYKERAWNLSLVPRSDPE